MTPALGCAVLAAGESKRLGRPKQLLVLDGKTLLRRAIEAVCEAVVGEVAVVVGARSELVRAEIAGSGAAILENLEWAEGIASSLRAAAAWARARRLDRLLVAVCDQPLLTASHVADLAAASARDERAVASAYAGVRGVPAVFPSTWLERLGRLDGNRGAGALLRGADDVIELPWPDGEVDIDTEDDVARFGRLRAASRNS